MTGRHEKSDPSRVIVTKPDHLAGRIAVKNGDPFRYPGQNFWVHPVIIGKENHLVTAIKEFPVNTEEAADYINGFLRSKISLNMDPHIVYDYQTLLASAHCPSCGQPMDWGLTSDKTDRFCVAECCGMQYAMVPESVRVVSVPVAALDRQEEQPLADDDFLKELQNM